MLGRDGIGGLAVLAASLVLFWLTLGLPESPLVPIGPGVYPRFVLGVTAVLSALLVVVDFVGRRRRRAAEGEAKKARPNYTLVLTSFAIFGLYVGVLPALGFRLSTLLYMIAAQAVLEPPKTARAWIVLLTIALATTIATYYLFERHLSVLLPRGRWTDF